MIRPRRMGRTSTRAPCRGVRCGAPGFGVGNLLLTGESQMRNCILALLATGIAGCGGGGGSGAPLVSSDTMQLPPTCPVGQIGTPPNCTMPLQPPVTRAAAFSAVARNLPRFGSVVHSGIGDAAGITTDQVSVQFEVPPTSDPGHWEVRPVSLSMETHGVSIPNHAGRHAGSDDFLTLPNEFAGFSYRADDFEQDESSHEIWVTAFTVWNDTDHSDYLTFGLWDFELGPGLGSDSYIYGAFADGPELSVTHPPSMPSAGTATYLGNAQIWFHHASGVNETTATISLEADFDAARISGCIGCADDLRARLMVDDAAPAPDDSRMRVRLGPTSFDVVGSFRDRNVEVEVDHDPSLSGVGSWGGRFSNIPDDEGNPRRIAGTVAADVVSGGALIGAWMVDSTSSHPGAPRSGTPP